MKYNKISRRKLSKLPRGTELMAQGSLVSAIKLDPIT
jgi:hypothetical protein